MAGWGTIDKQRFGRVRLLALATALTLALSMVDTLATTGEEVALGEAPEAHAPTLKLERFQVTPDGFRVSVDFLYSQGDHHSEKAFTVQDTQAVLDQILGPVFKQIGGALAAQSPDKSGARALGKEFRLNSGANLGIWHAGKGFSLTSSAQQLHGNRIATAGASPAKECDQYPARGSACDASSSLSDMLRGHAFSDKLLKTFRLSAAWQPSNSFSLGVDYYNSSAQNRAALSPPVVELPGGTTGQSKSLSAKTLGIATPGTRQAALATQLDAVSRGVDLNLDVGGELGSLGALAVHLKVRKVLDRALGKDGKFIELMPGDGLLPDTNGAEFGVDWSKGNFSGGVTSRYFDDLQNNDRQQTWMTLDMQFKWNTPWNGSLEIGARNLLGGDMRRLTDGDAKPSTELDRLLGRIPYVQYKQDL